MIKILDDKTHFHQWDINQKLIVDNKDIKELHYSNATIGKALVVSVIDGIADVPNILLQNAFDIKVYGFCGECVRDTAVFNVISRAKPEDYVYTETEIKRYETLEADIEELKEKTTNNSEEIEVIKNKITLPEINPVFEENSWETIAEVARLGIAQNYWNVGDYKILSMREFTQEENAIPFIVDKDKFIQTVLSKGITSGNLVCKLKIEFSSTPYSYTMYKDNKVLATFHKTNSKVWDSFGIAINNDGLDMVGEYFNNITISGIYDYPVQIIGFNHDRVTNKVEYGREKAGITLQIGASRNIYGDTKPSLYNVNIDGLMTDRGYYKAPNGVLNDFTDGATNWSESGFRKALQNILDNTELANYIVPVQKYTSKYYQSNIYWSDALLTNDKVFLPSEYEVFGQQILAPYIEGEQYEFYKDGYSKFMWSEKLLNGTSTVGRLWLRSAYAKKVNEIKGNSNYSLNVYLGVTTISPVNVLYSPSYATGGDGVIAPCFCM